MNKEEYRKLLLTKEWKSKRQSILERDSYKCTRCGSIDKLNIHHIKYIRGRNAWEYDNSLLITLCYKCHSEIHNRSWEKDKKETFIMIHSTEGLEWLTEFNSLRDLQVFMYMVEFQEPKSKIIIFSSLQIQECAKFLNCTEKTIRNSISSLIGTKFLKRLAMHNYISNPLTFYKGGTLGLHTSIQLWEKY